MLHFETFNERIDAMANLAEPLVELLLDEGFLATKLLILVDGDTQLFVSGFDHLLLVLHLELVRQVLGFVIVRPIVVLAAKVLVLLDPGYLSMDALAEGLLDIDHVGVIHLLLGLDVLLEGRVQLMHLLIGVLRNFGRLDGGSGAWRVAAGHPLHGVEALGQPGLLAFQELKLRRQFFLWASHELADDLGGRRLVLEDLLVVKQ